MEVTEELVRTKLLRRLLNTWLPFLSRADLLLRELSNVSSVLDLGCGFDSSVGLCDTKYKVGADLFLPYLSKSRQVGAHDDYVLADIRALCMREKSFDTVLALDVLEHLTKSDGYKLLGEMSRIAIRKIIVFTPNGYLYQSARDGNPFQTHRSGWTVEELQDLGFRIEGLNGWKPLRTQLAALRFRPSPFWQILSDASQKFVYARPQYAFQLFCVRPCDRSNTGPGTISRADSSGFGRER
jgi:hypothetical protein